MASADFKIKGTIILEHTVERKEKAGTPDRTRTCDLLIRSQTVFFNKALNASNFIVRIKEGIISA